MGCNKEGNMSIGNTREAGSQMLIQAIFYVEMEASVHDVVEEEASI
jgi:hypothetical protein